MTGAMTAVERELDEKRLQKTQEILAGPGKDLADLSDVEFAAGLARITRVQERMQKILATVLKKGRHYDNPNNAFQHPILLKAGAEEIRRLMRVRIRRTAEPEVVLTEEWVSVTVHLGIFDEMGRMLAERSANCNTKEARFRRKNGEGFVYRDAREMLHQCLAMADKRASADLTEEASGATGYFQTEAALTDGIDIGSAIEGCTTEDKVRLKDAAFAKRMTKKQFFAVLVGATGREMGPHDDEPFVAKDEVQMALDAIMTWEPPHRVEPEPQTTHAAPSAGGDDAAS